MRNTDLIVVVAYGWAWQNTHVHIVQNIKNN